MDDIRGRFPLPAVARASRPIERTIEGLLAAIGELSPLLVVLLLVLSGLLVLAFVPCGQNADDLLPTLISTQKLTVYFWGQNRFANVLPALTGWIHSPVRNAEAQLAMRVFAGMLAPAFFCAMFYSRASDVWRATLAADCLLLLANSASVIHETYVVASPYGTSFACGAGAILCLQAGWRGGAGGLRAALKTAGVVLLLAANLENCNLGMIAIPMSGLLALLWPSPSRYRLLVLNILATTFAFLAPSVFAPEYATSLVLAPSPVQLARFAASVWAGTGWVFAAWALLPAPIAVALRFAQGDGRSGWRLAVFALVSFTAASIALVIAGTSRHVALNFFNIRYAIPPVLAMMSLAGIGCWEAFRACLPTRRSRSSMLIVVSSAALMLAGQRLGPPGRGLPDIIDRGDVSLAYDVAGWAGVRSLDGIAGDYWPVWPAVFMTEQFRHEAEKDGETARDTFGVAQRGEPRRVEFLAILAQRGVMRLGCIDLAVAACRDLTIQIMRTGPIGIREFAAAEPLPDGHELRFVEVSPAPKP
jgi:hypothetical protein